MGTGLPLITAQYQGQSALRDSLVEIDGKMLFDLPGDFALSAGTPVLVRVSCTGLEPGIYLEGIAQPRRRDPRESGATALLAAEVHVSARERPRFEFLAQWAANTRLAGGRKHWRIPHDTRVHVQSLGVARTTSRLMHTTTVDVSLTGVQLLTPRALARDELVVLLVNSAGSMQDFQGVVVWSGAGRSGLKLTFDGEEARNAWAAIVLHAENALASGEVRMLRTSVPRLRSVRSPQQP